jgi:hypothetical protein
MAIISLVLGLAAVGVYFRGFHTMTVPIGIIGLILGVIAVIRKSKRGVAIAGIILNAIVVLWPVGALILWGTLGD